MGFQSPVAPAIMRRLPKGFSGYPHTMTLCRCFLLAFVLIIESHAVIAAPSKTLVLKGHVPKVQMQDARLLGPMDQSAHLDLVFGLPLRKPADLERRIHDLYDPSNPHYGQFLTPEQFTETYGPSKKDLDRVVDHLKQAGYVVISTSSNRVLIRARATVATIEKTLDLRMNRYRGRERSFYSATDDPRLPAEIAGQIMHIVGLQNARVRHPLRRKMMPRKDLPPILQGTGPFGGLSPGDIAKAYSLPGGSINGEGQTLALFQMDGFLPSDVKAYTDHFNLRPVPLEAILVGDFDGSAGEGSDEVCMDIELMNAIAPGAAAILVYEGHNTDQGVLDVYNRIVSDNRAQSVSTSWGLSEYETGRGYARLESQFFMQMAAQGQSFYAASGDNGAFDTVTPEGTPVLGVDDPAGQPFVTGVGGTRLNLGPNQSYASEVVWNSYGGSSGGGISAIWKIPEWQTGTVTAASKTMRNVPDVALNGAPDTGYSVFTQGRWYIISGTSASAPLWAGFTALVNQSRALKGLGPLGFANPMLYEIANSASYGTRFHDVTIGNNNFYSAGLGYDNTTGWGSFQGGQLITDLSRLFQTVRFTRLPGALTWGSSLSLAGRATASSGLPITYTAGPSKTCQINGTVLSTQYPGSCRIQAKQPGNALYAPASTHSNIEVLPPRYPGVTRTLTVRIPHKGGTVRSYPAGIACGDDQAYCSQQFTRLRVVTLKAVAVSGARFLGWTGACHGKAPTCQIRMLSDHRATARFQ